MHALAVFPERKEIRIITPPEPRALEPRQVLLRVREVGICGTDREIASFMYGEAPRGADHLILGHEALAVVHAVGDAVEHLHPGQFVVPLVRLACAEARCLPCRTGRQDFCVTGRFRERGIHGADGFLVDWTVDEEENLVPVPAAMADVGVLIEPLTIATKAIMQVRRFKQRLPLEPRHQRALVLGAGPVGLLAAMASVASSYETIVYSRESADSERAAFVEGFGAQYVSSQDSEIPALAAATGPVDVLVEATGYSPLAFAAVELLGPNGIYVLSGVPGGRPKIAIDTDRMMRDLVLKNQIVFGTVNAGFEDYVDTIHLLEQFVALFPESVRGLITGRHPLDEAPALLAQASGIKSVVTFA